MARTRGGASRDAGSLYARTRATVSAAARRLGDRDDARCAAAVSALLCAFELVFCVAIIAKVPYTEIDWRAYMAQVRARSSAGGGDGRFARSSGS